MVFPFAGIDLVGESDGTVPIHPAGISSRYLKQTFWFVVLRNTFGMPGLDDQDENVDFETQLLEELLEHFETGARASFDQTTPYICVDLHASIPRLTVPGHVFPLVGSPAACGYQVDARD